MRLQFSRTILVLAILSTAGCSLSTSNDSIAQSCNRHSDFQCAAVALIEAEKRLAETYQRIADREEDEGVKRLGITQRHWSKYRESYADFIAMHEADANAFQLALLNQKIDMTLSRIDELQRLLTKKNPQ